jgi:hypothetical protein
MLKSLYNTLLLKSRMYTENNKQRIILNYIVFSNHDLIILTFISYP